MTEPKQEPLLKRVLDNPWLMLALGLLVPILSYSVWGWISQSTLPPATLP